MTNSPLQDPGAESDPFRAELKRGDRYAFGDNWRKFLELLNEDRIRSAEDSLVTMLGRDRLDGLSFLDIGSGSGLFSLAARRLGAKVTSFDYDPSSVWCTTELRRRYHPTDPTWTVLRGSVLDQNFMARLPAADIVYSWGVLHHTGRMYDAIRSAAQRVRSGGLFYVALYRRTILCPAWKVEKRLFSAAPEPVRIFLRAAWVGKTKLACRLKGRSFENVVAAYGGSDGRGMDYYRDVDDWLGGWPYESITPPECRAFFAQLGFSVIRERAVTQSISFATSSGCDEWVFQRKN